MPINFVNWCLHVPGTGCVRLVTAKLAIFERRDAVYYVELLLSSNCNV